MKTCKGFWEKDARILSYKGKKYETWNIEKFKLFDAVSFAEFEAYKKKAQREF